MTITAAAATTVAIYASMGSPSAVPVPCASKASAQPPLVNAAVPDTVISKRSYDAPFGAVRLALGPSCYTADPGIETHTNVSL